MEKNEFNEWLKKHQRAYPALAEWFSSLPDQKGTLAIWFDVFRWLELEHADEATMRMIRGVEPLVRYNNWHDTPRFVTEHAECLKRESKQRKRFTLPPVDGEPTYRCADCFDTGIIDVFHSRDVKEVRRKRFAGIALHRSARSCTCDIGRNRYRGLIERGYLATINLAEDVRVPTDRETCTRDSVDVDVALIEEVMAAGNSMTLDEWIATQ